MISLGVLSPGTQLILVIGRLDCVGGPSGRYDWLARLSEGAWSAGHPIGMHCAVAVSPRGVRIVYIRGALAGRSSIAAAPVTGSHLHYAPVCCFAVNCTAELCLWLLFGGIVCFSLAGRDLFFRRVVLSSMMATDGVAATEGRPGITFDVELVVPWDAPEAVVDLSAAVLRDLELIPDVIGLSGRWSEAAGCRILQGRDERSVQVLIPDSRGLERDFHDVTIVDMGDLPEVPVSMDDFSLLRRQWLTAVLRHMV